MDLMDLMNTHTYIIRDYMLNGDNWELINIEKRQDFNNNTYLIINYKCICEDIELCNLSLDVENIPKRLTKKAKEVIKLQLKEFLKSLKYYDVIVERNTSYDTDGFLNGYMTININHTDDKVSSINNTITFKD